MTSKTRRQTQAYVAPATVPRATLRCDGAVALACSGLISGLYLDGWAHVHHPDLETFFTPWHGILYSGFLLVALTLVAPVLLARRHAVSWRTAIPVGYGLGLIGVALFAFGGLGDLSWHIVFGIEADTEALLSPPHLLLATGVGLMVSTPLRSAWVRNDAPRRWASWLPPLLSISLLLALMGFFTSYAHPFTATAASRHSLRPDAMHTTVELAMASILVQSMISSGSLLVLIRRWGGRWPFGSLTILTTLTLAPLTLMYDRFLSTGPLPLSMAAVLAGLVSDGLLRLLRPTTTRPRTMRTFASAAPVTLIASYLAAIGMTVGFQWSLHLILGAGVLAGMAGMFVSYLVVPPAAPTDRAEPQTVQYEAKEERDDPYA